MGVRGCLIAVKFVKCPLDSAKIGALHKKWPQDPSHTEVLNVTSSLPAAIVKHSGSQDRLLLSKYRSVTILYSRREFFYLGNLLAALCCSQTHLCLLFSSPATDAQSPHETHLDIHGNNFSPFRLGNVLGFLFFYRVVKSYLFLGS